MRSEESYKHLTRFLLVLFIVEILLGLGIVVLCEYIKLIVSSRAYQAEKREIFIVIWVVKLFGLHVSFYFLCAVPVISLNDDVYTHHMGFILKFFVLLAVETGVGAITIAQIFSNSIKYLIESLEKSLVQGIKLYPTNPLWVLIWDELQYNYDCCGVYSYNDWLKINFTILDGEPSSKNWLPYSCAKYDVPLNFDLTDENIRSDGCFNTMANSTKLMVVFMTSLNMAIIVLLVG